MGLRPSLNVSSPSPTASGTCLLARGYDFWALRDRGAVSCHLQPEFPDLQGRRQPCPAAPQMHEATVPVFDCPLRSAPEYPPGSSLGLLGLLPTIRRQHQLLHHYEQSGPGYAQQNAGNKSVGGLSLQ